MVNLVDWAHAGGWVQHQLGLLQAWTSAGHDVRMISPRGADTSALPDALRPKLLFSPDARQLGLAPSVNTLLQIPAVLRQRAAFGPDVVYTRVNMLTPFLVAACRMAGMKVAVEHNSWMGLERIARGGTRPVAWLEERLQILAARWSHASRCVTQGIADRLRDAGVPASRLHSIGNGTDVAQFHPMARDEALCAFGLAPDKIYIGFIGNIMPWHGLGTAVDAFILLAPGNPELVLLVFGDGSERAALEAKLAAAGLAPRARFMGRVPAEQANAAINCFDVALLPLSHRNNVAFGFSSTKIRDYAAAGRLVLTGHLPGNIELTGQGWLVTHKPDNAADLAAVLSRLLRDSEARKSATRAARAYAEQHFSWHALAQRIEEIFRGFDGAAFAFGENWSSYATTINEAAVVAAKEDLKRLLGEGEIKGKRLIDIGCGSGLHALAARRLGASDVLAVDVDPISVETARKVIETHAPGAARFERASVFDLSPSNTGTFDVVYSWGVLHHTGDMNRAIECAARLVAPGGLFALALYRKTLLCGFWKHEKRWYAGASPRIQAFVRNNYISLLRLAFLVTRRDFKTYVAEYRSKRGMDFAHDVQDWLGGYPYESIRPEAVDEQMTALGFRRVRSFVRRGGLGLFGSGCDEFVYRRVN